MARNSKLSKADIVARVNDLLAVNSAKISKYQRDYSLYNQCPTIDLKGKSPAIVGYLDDVYSDDSVVPKLNVIKSAIDSVVSKISTARCRPYVNTVKGSFKTIQICKQLQIFFDYWFEEQKLQSKVVEALRHACIFDSGFIYIDETTGNLVNVMPWNVYTRQTEKGDFKSCFIEFTKQSVDTLNDIDFKYLKAEEVKSLYVDLGYFYDSRTKTKATFINRQIRDIGTVKSDCIPLVPIYFTPPIVGNSTLSVADMLKGIQVEVDELMKRISDASMVNPALTYFVPNATNIKVGQLNNRVGNIVQYNSPQGTQPIEVSTPNFISTQYSELLNNLIEKAYNLVGISPLSAQGLKTPGLNSGIALATQEDIESARFQSLLDQYIDMFTTTAKKMVKIYQSNKDIIEPSRYSLSLKWGDVEKEYDRMRIQFSTADSLSKDPSEKLKQLQTLAQAGIIPSSQIASLLELPDINRGYSVANNSYNTVNALIDACIYEDRYDIPPYVPYLMLKEQIINMELNLRSASVDGSNDKDIAKLMKYYELVEAQEQEITDMQTVTAQTDPSINNGYNVQSQPQTTAPNLQGEEQNANAYTVDKVDIPNPYETTMDVEQGR